MRKAGAKTFWSSVESGSLPKNLTACRGELGSRKSAVPSAWVAPELSSLASGCAALAAWKKRLRRPRARISLGQNDWRFSSGPVYRLIKTSATRMWVATRPNWEQGTWSGWRNLELVGGAEVVRGLGMAGSGAGPGPGTGARPGAAGGSLLEPLAKLSAIWTQCLTGDSLQRPT